ncbi:MAG: hypothetical protein Q7O12_12610, partial [Deltaproteobacteria bacterium]|nr:hypothetical protein [Deltaproteobacteria bacterium]
NLIFSAKDKDSKNSKLKTGIKRNVGPLLLKRMFFVTERLDAITKCQNLLESEGTAYVIGTGGSYPVAAFISIVLNRHGKLFSQPMHPFNYIRIGSLSNYVIVVSYSGSTPDCGAVIRKALSMGVRNVVLLTGSGNPKLKNLLQQNDNNVISYRTPVRSAKDITIEPPKERGFISFAGTVSPCTLWVSAVVGSVEMANLAGELNEFYNMADPIPNIAELGKLIKEKPGETVSVLGGGFAWPAMLDIESKFVEGDLGNVMLHEVKDFSHGRFMSLLGNDNKSPIIVLGVGPWHEYEQLVLKTVEQGRLIISIRSIFNDILGSLELLVKVQFFARWLGEYFNKDISRPKPPRAGIKLYKWKGQLE